MSTQLEAAVGAWRIDLAASLGGQPIRIVWDGSVPKGTDAVAESTMTIRIHPRLQQRSTRVLHDVLAHEFGHIMVIIALNHNLLSDPGVCHENVADEIASRLRARSVHEHMTVECTAETRRRSPIRSSRKASDLRLTPVSEEIYVTRSVWAVVAVADWCSATPDDR